MVLHYYSQRVGLWTWVEGIVDEVAKQIFGIQVRMERLRGRDTGDCDHEVGVGGRGSCLGGYEVRVPAAGSSCEAGCTHHA